MARYNQLYLVPPYATRGGKQRVDVGDRAALEDAVGERLAVAAVQQRRLRHLKSRHGVYESGGCEGARGCSREMR